MDAPATPRVSLIIPALNEADNLPHVLAGIPPRIDEVVLVDGGSTDGTVEVAIEHRPDIRVVRQTAPGKGNGLRLGIEAATGEVVVTIDGDGSMDLGELDLFLDALFNGADLAKGSRFLKGGGSDDFSPLRNVGNRAMILLTRLLFGGPVSDPNYGYNALWKRVLPTLALDAQGFEFEMLLNLRAVKLGLNVVEIPCFERKRMFGRSKLHSFRDGWLILRTILRERLRSQPRQDSGTVTNASPATAGTGRGSGST